MKLSEKREFISLRKKGKLRKKSEISRMWQLDQMYLEEKVESALDHYRPEEIIEAVILHTKSEDMKELQRTLSEKVTELANGGSTMIITGLNLATEEKLREFLEKEIYTTYNEQQLNIF